MRIAAYISRAIMHRAYRPTSQSKASTHRRLRAGRWALVLMQMLVLGVLLPAHHHHHGQATAKMSSGTQSGSSPVISLLSGVSPVGPRHEGAGASESLLAMAGGYRQTVAASPASSDDDEAHCPICHLIHALGHVGASPPPAISPAIVIDICPPVTVFVPSQNYLAYLFTRGPPALA